MLCWARDTWGCTALTPSTALLSPDVLRLPAAGRLRPLPSPEMQPHLPLPLWQRTRMCLPVLRGVQVSAGTHRAAGGTGQGAELTPPSIPQVLLLAAPAKAAGAAAATGTPPVRSLPGSSGGTSHLQHPGVSRLHQRTVPSPVHPGRRHCPQSAASSPTPPNPGTLASAPALGQCVGPPG